MLDVLIIGAGPAGLAISSCLKALGVEAQLVDRHGELGGAFSRLYPKTRLASPTSLTKLPGQLEVCADEYVTVEAYHDYLRRYAEAAQLQLTRGDVVGVAALDAPRAWRVALADGSSLEARALVFATGMADSPRWPSGFPLEDSPAGWISHSAQWRGPSADWCEVLIIGAGTSAVEIAEECAARGVHVHMATRQGKVNALPKDLLGKDLHYYLKPLELLPRFLFLKRCEAQPTVPATDLGFGRFVREGKIKVMTGLPSLEAAQRLAIWPDAQVCVDHVICATGFVYALPHMPQGFKLRGSVPHTDEHGQSTSHPGLFFMGFPCSMGISSEYLRGIAVDATRQAKRIQGYLRA